MFNFFKKKSTLDKLQNKHDKLLKEAYQLSSTNRTASDAKTAEAHEVMKAIDDLLAQKNQ